MTTIDYSLDPLLWTPTKPKKLVDEPYYDLNIPQVIWIIGQPRSGKGFAMDQFLEFDKKAGMTRIYIFSAGGHESLYLGINKDCRKRWNFVKDILKILVKSNNMPIKITELKAMLDFQDSDKIFEKYIMLAIDLKAIEIEDDYISITDLGKNILSDEPLHCYDKDTEVMTNEGFKFFNELNGKEKFLSLNPETFDLEYVKSKSYIKYHYKGNLLHFYNKWFDLMVTPKHKMFVEKDYSRHKKLEKYQFVDADKVKSSYLMYKSSKWKGTDINNIIIGNLSIPVETFCKFMGYYLSEGSCYKEKNKPNTWTVNISQYKKDNLQKFFDDLKQMPVKINKYKTSIGFSNVDIGIYLSQFGKSFEKYVPKEIKNLPPKYIRIFLDAYCLGDGTIYEQSKYNENTFKKGNYKKQNRYFTSSKQMADDIGELIIKVGKSPSYYFKKLKGTKHKFKNGTYIQKTDIWRINENTSIHAQLNKKPVESISYDDNVYCVELQKFHTLYVRRKGKCIWSGNCNCHSARHIMVMLPPYVTPVQETVDRFNGWYWSGKEEYYKAYFDGKVTDYIPDEPWVDFTKILKPVNLRPVPVMVFKNITLPMTPGKVDIFRKEFREMMLECRKTDRDLVNSPSFFTGDHIGKLEKYTLVAEILKYLPELSQKDFAPLRLDKPRSEWTPKEKSWHKISVIANEVRALAPSNRLSAEPESSVSKRAWFGFLPERRHSKCWVKADMQSSEDFFVGSRNQNDLWVIKRITTALLGENFQWLEDAIIEKRQRIFDYYKSDKGPALETANKSWPKLSEIPDNKAYVIFGNREFKLVKIHSPSWHHKSDVGDDFFADTGIEFIKDKQREEIEKTSKSEESKKSAKNNADKDEEMMLVHQMRQDKKKFPEIIKYFQDKAKLNNEPDSKWFKENKKKLSNRYNYWLDHRDLEKTKD